MSGSIIQVFGRLCRDRRGVSAIEFAIIAPIMVTLMLGAYDVGNAALQQIRLQEAVRSGGAYAISWPTDLSGIQTAVSDALPAGMTLTNPGGVAAVKCRCLDPATGTVSALMDCTTANFDTCITPNTGTVVSITATLAYTPLTPLPLFLGVVNTANYVARFQ
jgi:Flp pilus assembly protein TadG